VYTPKSKEDLIVASYIEGKMKPKTIARLHKVSASYVYNTLYENKKQ